MFPHISSFGLDFTPIESVCSYISQNALSLRPWLRVWNEKWEHVSWNNNLWIINGLVLEGSQRPPCEPEVSVNAAAAERRTDNNAPADGGGAGGALVMSDNPPHPSPVLNFLKIYIYILAPITSDLDSIL